MSHFTGTPDARRKLYIGLCLGVLLVAALAVISHADELAAWSDESWTIFHSSASIEQILNERDLTWPIGSFAALHYWGAFASWNDFSLHVFGALCGLLTTAFMILAGRRLHSRAAGLLVGLAFGTSSYALYFILEIRGYTLMLLAEAAFVAVYLRWLARPRRNRDVALFAGQVAMLYIHFILGLIIALAGLHLLLTAPRRLGRWLLIAAATGIGFLPLLPQLLAAYHVRSGVGSNGPLPSYFTRDFGSFLRAFSAHWDVWLAVIGVLCCVGLARALMQRGARRYLWLLVWGVGIPLYAYVTRYTSALFTTRYLSFTIPAIFLLVGVGLATLSSLRVSAWMGAIALLVLALAPWQPFDHRPAPSDNGAPLHQFFRVMAQRFQPGDTLIVDPHARSFDDLAWSYYENLYIPSGPLPQTTDPTRAGRRIWFVVRQGSEDNTLQAAVQQGRLPRDFWGPWYLAATLYEAPPLPDGILFGDSLRFRGAQVQRRSGLHAGDLVSVTLWWSADKPIIQPLSISVQVLNGHGRLVSQGQDGPPQGAQMPPMTAWPPGLLYLDQREIQIPYQPKLEQPGDEKYTIHLIVYQPLDGTRLVPSSQSAADNSVVIDQAILYSYAVW
ncbi:MAG TPA: hypothetical protein VKQ72_00345 [Aggregatilineales bacterium]|nr:hypothetical protein [Aggregatilineales bacterium]